MSWAAANVPRRKESSGNSNNNESPSKSKDTRKRGETVEAVLSRLSKAYSISMECLGAMHQANATILKKGSNDVDSLQSLKAVATAARDTLERAVLLDPLVVEHSPTLRGVLQQYADRDSTDVNDKWVALCKPRPDPPSISSKSHRSTIRQLAYLALTNYADLLMTVCTCQCTRSDHANSFGSNAETLLDRGVVKKLAAFTNNSETMGCCWAHDTEEDIQRLALAALCDASALDGSDPVVWLKLACAARAMGHIQTLSGRLENPVLSPFRRLERHALESGYTALPPHVPPNRAIKRLLDDFIKEEMPDSYPSVVAPTPQQCKLNLNLTRYSWSLLGRLLMRIIKEGTGADDTANKIKTSRWMVPFGSPVVSLSLSPMLRLPSRVLARTLSYLEACSIWNFEATCRALSVSIMSVRATLERQGGRDIANTDPKGTTEEEDVVMETAGSLKNTGDNAADSEERKEDGGEDGESKTNSNSKISTTEPTTTRVGRSSKRVRSQQITSDKREDRLRKRKSVGYCLRAATLSCTVDDAGLKETLKEKYAWDTIKGEEWKLPATLEKVAPIGKGKSASMEGIRHQLEASERIGSSSLSSFLQRLSSQNAGPCDLLVHYLGHVALHVEEVFSVDPGGRMDLNVCIAGCFDLVLKQQKFQKSLIPHFFINDEHDSESPALTSGGALELFAMDLLNVELCFRACERQKHFCISFDDDSSYVSCMIPILLEGMDSLNKSFMNSDKERDWIKIKARVNWLASGVFLWRSRLTRSVSESIEAEEQGLKYIGFTIDCLSIPQFHPIENVPTPHLESLGRSGLHWKALSGKSLVAYRDEIQASSVVSHAQQQFQERVAEILRRQKLSPEAGVSEEDISALSSIGEALLARYAASFGDRDCKQGELLENFMSVHGDAFLSGAWDIVDDPSYARLAQAIPTKSIDQGFNPGLSNPSILSILIVCLRAKASNQLRVVELLVRIILKALDRYEQLCRAATARKSEGESKHNLSDSEDDENSVGEGSADSDNIGSHGMGTGCSAMRHGRFAKFILDQVKIIVSSFSIDGDKLQLAASGEFQRLIHHSIAFSSSWINEFTQQPSVLEEQLDLKLFKSLRGLLYTIWEGGSDTNTAFLKNLFLSGLVRITKAQRLSFEPLVRVQGTIRARRAVRQRICILRAEFIGTILCEIGNLLSKSLFTVASGRILRSQILSDDGKANDSVAPPKLAILIETILWFCGYAGLSPVGKTDENAMSSFDRPIADRLLVPLAVAIVSLCGAGASTRSALTKSVASASEASKDDEDKPSDQLCLIEFLDSDASARELSDSENDEVDDSSEKGRKEMIRVVCHAVHCVGIVFGSISEKEIISFDSSAFYGTDNGPLLPLVVARVLNHIADTLLVEFGYDDIESESSAIWARSFPFGTGAIGALLDSALYKAYKCLHGFTLTGASDQYSSKEHVSNTTGDIETTRFVPESHKAAAQLYRCVFRAGKKTPPKAALETVSSALPALRESEKSKMIREFVYSSDTKLFELDDIVSIVSTASNWENHFQFIQEWEQADASHADNVAKGGLLNGAIEEEEEEEEEVILMRRGIFLCLAQGDLPTFSNEGGGSFDDRTNATHFEKELSKKLNAILNTLCFADTYSVKGWYRASQVLIAKSEAVSDRLGLSKGYSRSKNFCIPHQRPPAVSRLPIAHLKEKQQKDSMVKELGWIQFLGDSLLCYANSPWSSFESLKVLSEIHLKPTAEASDTSMPCDDDIDEFKRRIQTEIGDMLEKRRFVEWQEAWGGMFVSALRKMAVRCMVVAIFFIRERAAEVKKEDKSLLPEILESLGTVFYTGILGSQSYGYPMHVMENHLKRLEANAARVCFRGAADVALSQTEDGKAEIWDLLFMIGKCHEKIAGTLKLESFPLLENARGPRQFEIQTKEALGAYQAALDENPSSEHGEAGGSSHGIAEVRYRLHASRLKCLILAASASEDDRNAAEEEALRLTEKFWFSPPKDVDSLDSTSIRDRIWNVLADIVSALAQCRLEHSFFHRSVYRHAQALMWAPVLCDPVAGRAEGSKSTVPATKSYHLRGLNHATNAAKSALAVISTLFEKKRTQLCAVWVTTSFPPMPFETVNNSVRKYDSLRGKYIAAYIEALRLDGNRSELETLLRWISSSKRDLPSLFCASAMAGGGKPDKNTHIHESLLIKSRSLRSFHLLTGLRREANNAMASVLKDELVSKDSTVRSPELHLKLAYACFLRLNGSIKELKKTRTWKYEPGGVNEAEALIQAYLKSGEAKPVVGDPNDWSGGAQKEATLSAALAKCKELFPSISAAFYSKKAMQKSKNRIDNEEKEETERGAAPQQSGTKRSFEVEVPGGLEEGETFTTTIATGSNSKRVKLTVPAGKPRMLRFSLDLSTQLKE